MKALHQSLPNDDRPRAARDVPTGESWAFLNHRTLAEVIRDERAAKVAP